MFPLLASWNEFAGMPIMAPLNGSITKAVHRKHIEEYSSAIAFASVGQEIK
jgi:hypothetical protein